MGVDTTKIGFEADLRTRGLTTMPIPVSFFGSSYLDSSNEKSHFKLAAQTMTAANFNAQVTNIGSLLDAILAITLGNEISREIVASRANTATTTPPTDPHAQRENKWLLLYHDTSGRRYKTQVPCADLTNLQLGTDEYDYTGTTSGPLWTTLVSAWAVAVVSPEDPTRATVLDRAVFVGRNL